jgi:hypothetical protein
VSETQLDTVKRRSTDLLAALVGNVDPEWTRQNLIDWFADDLPPAIARAEAAEALDTAVRAAGPWPKVVYTPYTHETRCVHCQRHTYDHSQVEHSDSCPGVQIAALLAATGTDNADG